MLRNLFYTVLAQTVILLRAVNFKRLRYCSLSSNMLHSYRKLKPALFDLVSYYPLAQPSTPTRTIIFKDPYQRLSYQAFSLVY